MSMVRKFIFVFGLGGLLIAAAGCATTELRGGKADTAIVITPDATELEQLAAKEIRRYLYLRTGELPTISQGPTQGDAIVLQTNNTDLQPQQYRIATVNSDGKRTVAITGGDEIGTLYGAYRFIEHFGVRFYLHGDTIPDGPAPLELPAVDEVGKPLFELRGIHPFHDFPEGPDWWNENDYKAIIGQLPKLGMNFFALHTYPEKRPNAEPTVWIGLSEDVGPDGKVAFSYPSSYQNTLRGNWGYAPKRTSEFNFAAAQLFERDDYGAEVMSGMMPEPKTPEQYNELFNRVGDMLGSVFEYAHKLGVRTCVGTETPLVIPELVKKRLKDMGKEPNDPAVVRDLYAGMFERIKRAYPLDYYWLWTPEGWTWSDVKDEQVAATQADLLLAVEAAENVGAPFTLATCGWVLGPPNDRAQFDRVLPKEMPFSCINREVGFSPVDANFAKVTDRPKWAIPWLEDDPAIISPQLWVGRMRRDAVDALRYGCTGLMGIHWRTRSLAPNVSALAKAGWEQGSWAEAAHSEPASRLRDLPTEDFYLDWARTQFGPEAAEQIAHIFVGVDGAGRLAGRDNRRAGLPRTSEWVDGPGAIRVEPTAWSRQSPQFDFVEKFAKLRGKIKGAGNRERFDYWLNTFRYARSIGQVGCIVGRLDETMKRINAEQNSKIKKRMARNEALGLRRQLAKEWAEMVTYLLAVVSNAGEMGTVANLEQHSMKRLRLLNKHDSALEKILAKPLPTDAMPWKDYRGKARIIVPTVRGNLAVSEDLKLKVIILSKNSPAKAALYWRQMGNGAEQMIPLEHAACGVYMVTIPKADIGGKDFEYHIKAEFGWGRKIYFPATAPDRNQTVVVN